MVAPGVNANQIYFRCDVAEIGKVYEYYATNGDDARAAEKRLRGLKALTTPTSKTWLSD